MSDLNWIVCGDGDRRGIAWMSLPKGTKPKKWDGGESKLSHVPQKTFTLEWLLKDSTANMLFFHPIQHFHPQLHASILMLTKAFKTTFAFESG